MRLDWIKIRALSLDAGNMPDDNALFVLPVAGRDLLMSLMERLEWEATFRVNGYDYSDWDFLQSIVSSTENGLMGTILMDDLIEQLTRIADSLEQNLCCVEDELVDIKTAVENLSIIVNCGGGGGEGVTLKDWRFPDDWENDWPIDPTPEDDTPTSEPLGNLCDFAHSAWHEIDLWFQQFAQNVNAANPYKELTESVLWAQLVASSLLTPYQAWVWQAMNATVALLYDDLLTDVASHWASLKDEFICQVLENDNGVDLRDWVFQAIRDNPPEWSAGYYMEVLLTGTHFTALYDGSYNPLPEFIGSDCAYCSIPDTPDAPEGYFWATLISGEYELSVNAGSGSVSYIESLGQFTMTPLTAATFHEVTVNVDISDIVDRLMAQSAHAILVQYIEPAPVQISNNGIALSSNTGGTTVALHSVAERLHYDNTEYGSVALFEDFVDAFSGSKTNYGNGQMVDAKASFRMQSYGSSGAATIVAVISYLLKE